MLQWTLRYLYLLKWFSPDISGIAGSCGSSIFSFLDYHRNKPLLFRSVFIWFACGLFLCSKCLCIHQRMHWLIQCDKLWWFKFYLKPLIKQVEHDYFNLSQQVNLHIQENCVSHVVMLNFFTIFCFILCISNQTSGAIVK